MFTKGRVKPGGLNQRLGFKQTFSSVSSSMWIEAQGWQCKIFLASSLLELAEHSHLQLLLFYCCFHIFICYGE